MSRPKSSWGSLFAAGSATATALQTRKTNRQTKQLLDLVSRNGFEEERRHKEQLLVTILASERTRDLFAQKLNELNQEFSAAINTLSVEMREISKSNWDILNHLETRQAEREYGGRMFHLVSTLMDDLEYYAKISDKFPEYVLVRANAWEELFESLNFGLEKFAKMDDSRKYDRAKKVFNDLDHLIHSLTDITLESNVYSLDECLANQQEQQNKMDEIKQAVSKEKLELESLIEQLEVHEKKRRPQSINVEIPDVNLHEEQVNALDEKINALKQELSLLEETPVEIKSMMSEIDRLEENKSRLQRAILYHGRNKPHPFSSRSAKQEWKSEKEKLSVEYLTSG